MKRIIVFIFALVMMIGMLAACLPEKKGGDNQRGVEMSSQNVESTKPTLTEEGIRALMAENLNCMYNIFVLNHLPIQGDFVAGQSIYPVNTYKFATFEEFENYVRSVYSKETADLYLYNFPYEGEPMYFEKDCLLYIDLNKVGGKGYYVDWSNYTVTINSCENDACSFTLNAQVEWPGEEPQAQDYPVEGKAVFENGTWLLTKMLF